MQDLYKAAGQALAGAEGGGFRSVSLYRACLRDGEAAAACTRHRLANESGTGTITVYRVFPGMELVYNDLRMEHCGGWQARRPGVIEINYCKEGRCECAFGPRGYCYMAAGDLSVCSLQRSVHRSVFPTAHYQGLTVTLDLAGITEEMRAILELLSIDLARISAASDERGFYLLRADAAVQGVFAELYTVREEARPGYSKIKLMELLLLLTERELAAGQDERRYLSRAQVERIKEIRDFVVEHAGEHYTIAALAKRFSLSESALKTGFKAVYGAPVYAYLRTYRLQLAERLLREGRLSVAQIAAQVGYANPNKFTSAFRARYGMPPTAYQKEYPNG